MPQWDLARADCVLVIGSNMAENHPIAFRFALQAKARGAVLIHADPRFTRTSAMCDLYAPIRAGTDIAFMGGIIHHLLEHELWWRDWAIPYTNIATVIEAGYRGPAENEGLFSGWNAEERRYSAETWQYEGQTTPSPLAESWMEMGGDFAERVTALRDRPPTRDETLQHPNCVYQILRRHYASYTTEMVERVTGCPRDVFLQVCDALARNSGPDRTGAICYAVGWNHHTTGAQIIRTSAIVQALLGNVGRPGGGMLALRGHTSIQGSTDIASLYDMLPGYLPQPHELRPHGTLDDRLRNETSPTGWWANLPDYYVSLLRAWYGGEASAANGWGHDWMPRIVGDHGQLPTTLAMRDGIIKGLFVMGQNPVVGGSNAKLVQRSLARLDWMVVRDIAETDTATFWRDGHLVRDGEMRPEEIGTEVFLMPASLAGEKPGSFTNTHRLVQWHDKVVEAPGDSRSEHWFLYQLGLRLKAAYAGSTRVEDAAIRNLNWDYSVADAQGEPDAEAVLREINGYRLENGAHVARPDELKADGSTAGGCWIYAEVFPEPGRNLSRARVPDGPEGPGTHLSWGFAWPANRRTLNNRASADPAGQPWSER
jgi:formate dehydrogenase major subunit